MSYSSVSLLDLSDEILLIILKKLKWVHIFDSLFNVDERLNRLILDSVIHASYIDLFVISSTDKIDSIAKTILDRICSSILPQIHQHIKCLALESSSMERILLATDYPKLKILGLLECGPEMITHHLNDESPLTHLLTQQITELLIQTNKAIIKTSPTDFTADIFEKILDICTNLTNLCFVSRTIFSNFPMTACFSSTLVDLFIEVETFDDCLYLLDDRLNNLCTLKIDIEDIDIHSLFIDGIHIRKEILVHMPQLRTFNFSIQSLLYIIDGMNLPSREDIQRTFIDEKLYKVNCSVDYWATKVVIYHIYKPWWRRCFSHILSF